MPRGRTWTLEPMPSLKLKIDVFGTVGDEAWHSLRHFDLADNLSVDFRSGCGSPCQHPVDAPHPEGEYIGAAVHLETMLLAQYAVAYYLEQDCVLDADVETD